MRIAVCDDNSEDRKTMIQLCRMSTDSCGEEQIFYEYESGQEFFKAEDVFDVLFLDVEMPGMTGVEVKNRLRVLPGRFYIVFVTDHEEIVREAFGPHVYDFVVKTEMEEKIPDLMRELAGQLGPHIMIEGMDSREIVYIISKDNYVEYVMSDGKKNLLLGTVNELERLLVPCDFIRISRGCIVNYRAIQEVWGRLIRTRQGKLEISYRRKKEVEWKIRELNIKYGGYGG